MYGLVDCGVNSVYKDEKLEYEYVQFLSINKL
jgi:hypothetical protein